MRKYMLIGTGGVVGAILRFLIKDIYSGQFPGGFPWDTLLINAIGCFLLALMMGVALEVLELNSDLRLGLTTGLLGAFTTFSTICKEATSMILQGSYAEAIFYAAVTLFFGFAAVYFGTAVSRGIIRARTKHRERNLAGQAIEESGEQE